MRTKLRQMFKRSASEYPDVHYAQLRQVATGWVNYFKIADCKRQLQNLDSLLRTRIRLIYWHKWKRPKTRLRNLQRLKVPKRQIYQWANSSKGCCRVAHSPILTRAMSNQYLRQQGLPSFYTLYESKEKQLSMF